MINPELCYGIKDIKVLQLCWDTDAISSGIAIEIIHFYTIALILETTHIPILWMLRLGIDSHHHKMTLECVENTVRRFL